MRRDEFTGEDPIEQIKIKIQINQTNTSHKTLRDEFKALFAKFYTFSPVNYIWSKIYHEKKI